MRLVVVPLTLLLQPAAAGVEAQSNFAQQESWELCDPAMLAKVGCPLQEYGVDWQDFLEEACRHCTVGRPCQLEPESDALVAQMQMVLGYAHPYKCVAGLLSALVVSAQFFLIKADLPAELEDILLKEDISLTPFPFFTMQYSLFANMSPARLLMCDNARWHEMDNVYVPRVHPEDSGRCGMVYDDQQLVRKCRSRRYDTNLGLERHDILQGITCPAADISLDPPLAFKLQKYGERAEAHQCQSSKGMWREAMSDVHKCVLITVAHIMDFRPGQLVLDWGSGCGHKLSWAKQLFGVDGVGLDVEGKAVQWAQQHSAGIFCHADGRNLEWLPAEAFDHVISYAALYHLPKTDQCHAGIQLLRKLRVGGKAFFGWNKAYSMNAWEWRACLLNTSKWEDLPAEDIAAMEEMRIDFQAIEDGFLFAPKSEVAEKHYLYQYPAFSLLLTRLA